MPGSPKSEMALEILSYVTRRPDAQDTLEGILEWWVPESTRSLPSREVRGAVDELVAAGFLILARGRDRQERYRLNLERRDAAVELVRARQRFNPRGPS